MAVHAASCLYNTHLAESQGMPGTLKNKKGRLCGKFNNNIAAKYSYKFD